MEELTEFKIFQQTDIIDNLMSHLTEGIMGMTIANDWDYERIDNVVYFKLKPGGKIQLDVIFWFGFFTNG
ncbi:MAG: hypothetical protein E2590_12730 [Chryseobacterium sp.]|nr:hypothetical protein [Chryseobacterium sp.]